MTGPDRDPVVGGGCGPVAPLSLYRQVYALVGVPWPGEAEVRRRHPVDDAAPEPPACVWQLRWPASPGTDHTDRTGPADQGAAGESGERPTVSGGGGAALGAVRELAVEVRELRGMLRRLLECRCGGRGSGCGDAGR